MNNKIVKLIRQIAGEAAEQHHVCKVKSVNTSDRTAIVTPLNGDPDIEIKLQTDEKMNTGWIINPTVGSHVIIGYINNSDAFIEMFSEVDKVHFKTEGIEFEVSKDTIKLNGDNKDGLVIVGELVNKLNDIKDVLNDLIDKYNSHTHKVSTSGTATAQTGTASATLNKESKTIQKVNKSDLENTKVKHGN